MVQTMSPSSKYFKSKLEDLDNRSLNDNAIKRISAMEAIMGNYNQ